MHRRMRAGRTRTSGRRARAAGLLLLAPLLLAAGCSGNKATSVATGRDAGVETETGSGASATPAPPVSKARITVAPADGVAEVEPDKAVLVHSIAGKLTAVKVTDADGDEVEGELDADATWWRAGDDLALGKTYTVTAAAEDADGVAVKHTSTFSTVKPRRLVRTSVVPLNGETVGVGQPISVRFNTSIRKKYRAAVQKKMKVTSVPAVTGSWHWIDGERLRYRPKTYWPAGTRVALRIDLENLKAGDRVYGGESRTIRFTIGRSMVSVVDIGAHRMSVYRDGRLARTIPVSTGRKGFETRGGVKVVLGKDQKKVMDGASIGIPKDSPDYYRLDVFWAVRVTWSGEFVHAAPWSTGAQGRANVSHGCVGMSNDAAKWFFDNTIRGDVIKVEGNPGKRMELDNGFGDWNIPWSTWKAGSALA